MNIEILNYTEDPIDVISLAAGTSYGKTNKSYNRVKNCVNAGHISVLEHASVTLKVCGISRACSHQLVRHRMASYIQKSQRYTKIEEEDWNVIPKSFKESERFELLFKEAMKYSKDLYNIALESGIKPEDARYLLPEATKTDITITMNARELFHFFDLRLERDAQWEIRNLSFKILNLVRNLNSQWEQIIELYIINNYKDSFPEL